MVYWHIETDFVAIAVFAALFLKAHFLYQRKTFTDRSFELANLLGIAAAGVDVFSSTVMNDLTGWWPYELGMIAYGLFAPLLTIEWVLYTVSVLYGGDERKTRRLFAAFLLPYLAYALVCITNPIHQMMFTLSPELDYARGQLFIPLGIGSQMLYAAMGVGLVLINWRRLEHKSTGGILLFLYVMTTACYWIQAVTPGWLIISSAYAVSFLMCDATFESQRRAELYQEAKRSLEEAERANAALQAAQAKLEETAREAERANQAKSDFLSRMSHDIRTPINGIWGMLEIIRKNRDDQARVDDCLGKIGTASGYLLALINDVLDMSKLESGEMTLAHQPFDMEKLLRECADVIAPMAVESGIRLSHDLDRRLPHPRVVGSPLHLRQILMNLASNAVKYNKPGGSVECRVEETGASDDAVTYRFTISDTGIGMDQEYLKHLFEPFSQENPAARSKFGGTGLGLAIVKKIVDRLEGTIQVESRLGVGSTFTVTLRFERDLTAAGSGAPEEEQAGPADLTGVRVLAAEDNALNQEILRFFLEEAGAVVDMAENGQAAVDKFAASPEGTYRAILMDVMMPVMDGLAAIRAIRRLDRADAAGVPIIAMTANAFAEDAQRCREAGMNAHLSKPVDGAVLLRTVADYLR